MGLLDRLSKMAKSAGTSIGNTIDVTWDVASAPWTDNDDVSIFEQFGSLLRHAGAVSNPVGFFMDDDVQKQLKKVRRGGTLYGGARNVAAWTGDLAADSVLEPVKEGLELLNTGYREVVAEPISTALTFGSLLDDPNWNAHLDGLSWLDKAATTFSKADEIAEHRSPGQAYALAMFSDIESITDDEELAEVMNEDWWNISTGLTDAVFQVALDPFSGATKAARAIRGGFKVRALQDLAANGVKSKGGAKLAEFVTETVAKHGENASAKVRSQLFPSATVRAGDQVSSLLVRAANAREGVLDLTLRTFAGSSEAFETLAHRAPHFADAAARAMQDARDYIKVNASNTSVDPNGTIRFGRLVTEPGAGTHGEAAYRLAIEAADRANEALTVVENTKNLVGVFDAVPQVTSRGVVREAYTRNNIYQANPAMRVMRVINWTKPRRALNAHEPNLDIQIQRAMQEVGATVEQQDKMRSKMIDAMTAPQRRRVIEDTHDFIVQKVAKDIGLINDEFVKRVDEIVEDGYTRFDAEALARSEGLTNDKYDTFVSEIRRLREDARGVASEKTYTTADGVERLLLEDAEGLIDDVRAPSLSTQMKNYEWLPDTRRLSYLAKKVAKNPTDPARYSGPRELTEDALSLFYSVWKPVTLFGIRTPIRVGTDETMRRIADIGLVATGADIAKQLGSKVGLATSAGEEIVKGATREFAAPYADELYRGEVIQSAKPGVMMGRATGFNNQAIYDDTVGVDDWRTLTVKDKGYKEAYEHAANKQLAQAPLAKRLIQSGMDREAVVDWLKTGEGYKLLRTADNVRQLDPEGWVDDVASQIDWLLPTEELRDAALAGKATADDFLTHFPEGEAPGVHGQYLRDVSTGRSSLLAVVNKLNDSVMTWANTRPTVFLQRSPHFARKYADEVLRLERMALDNKIPLTDDLARTFEKRARDYALAQVKDLLFDMNEMTQLADSLKVVAPFANATREVTTRWAGIIWHKPEVIRRLQQVWQSPQKAGLEIDGNGNEVQGGGWSLTPDGQKVKTEGEISLRFSIPSGLPLPRSLKPAGGAIQFSKDSFNTILANPWGVGPVVTAAASVLLRDRPDVQESLKFMFPFGVPETLGKALVPSTFQRFTQSDSDESYMAMKGYYFNSLYAQWAQDGAPLEEGQTRQQKADAIWKEAEATVRQIAMLKKVFGAALPVQPTFASPYQAYLDIYRRYAKDDPTTADLRFAEDFGTELLALTTSVTKTVNGVPPTLEGWKGYKEHKELIDANPELGRIILGEVGGEFSRAVYRGQLRSGARRYRTKDEIMQAPEIEAGWMTFQKGMDAIDAERIDRGLPNLRSKRARDLAEAKSMLVDGLAEQYPAWAESYFTVDLQGKDRFVNSLRAITTEPSLREREDMQGLVQYIALRDSIKFELQDRRGTRNGSGTLESTRNRDLLDEWETGRAWLVERYLTFAPLFYRYFDNDMPEAG